MKLDQIFSERELLKIRELAPMQATTMPSAAPVAGTQPQAGLPGGQMDPAQAAAAMKQRADQKKQIQDQIKQTEQQLQDLRKRLAELG